METRTAKRRRLSAEAIARKQNSPPSLFESLPLEMKFKILQYVFDSLTNEGNTLLFWQLKLVNKDFNCLLSSDYAEQHFFVKPLYKISVSRPYQCVHRESGVSWSYITKYLMESRASLKSLTVSDIVLREDAFRALTELAQIKPFTFMLGRNNHERDFLGDYLKKKLADLITSEKLNLQLSFPPKRIKRGACVRYCSIPTKIFVERKNGYIDRCFVAALLNIIAFILTSISLFDENWINITIKYYGFGVRKTSIQAGICCSFQNGAAYLDVTLAFMFLAFFLSLETFFVSIIAWMSKHVEAVKVNTQKWIKCLVIGNIIIALIAIFLLFYTGISFATNSHNKFLKHVPGYSMNLSLCYWLLIPIAVLNGVSIFLLGHQAGLNYRQ